MKEEENKEEHCGNCCWFCHEDTDGFGICYQSNKPLGDSFGCSHICHIGKFVSREKMQHYQAVLLWYNIWRAKPTTSEKDYCPIEFEEISNAIDFASEYMKVFSEL